ncbi:ABC transporter substrate-binding protein, partial [Methanosarcinales archaeon]
MRKLFVLTVLLFAVVAAIAAEPEYIVEPYTGRYGGTLFLSTTSGPKTLNPANAQETSSTDIIGWFLEQLVDFDKNGGIRGGQLAKSWEVSEDGRSYIFHIRKGLKWSDGHPFTAEDVYFSFAKIWTNPDNAGDTYDVITDDEGNPPTVELIDEYTVKITYNKPFAPGLRYVGSVDILPKHALEEAVNNGTWLETWTVADIDKIVGMGPFIVKEYT